MRPVNLLPSGHRARAATARKGGAYAVLGVLAVLLLAVVAFVVSANQVTSRQSELAGLKNETERAKAATASLTQFASFADIKRTRLTSVQGLAAGRFDWERMVREVSRVVPSGVWVTSLDASLTGADSTSAAAAGATTVGPNGPTLKVDGCARRHPDVATTLVRLRQLHRALDVKLVKSAKPDAGAGGSPAPAPAASAGGTQGCAKDLTFEAIVTFSPLPPPTDLVPSAHKVPVSLGGGS